MLPRTEVDFLPVTMDLAEATKFAIAKAHSRYPVTRGSSDEVIGFIHVRDLLHEHMASHDQAPRSTLELIRPVLFLPGTKGVLPALTEMQGKRAHIAVVLDEYGGTDGIVTFEDLVECIIGDIHDEYDQVEDEVTQLSDPSEYEVDALISLEDLYQEAGIALPDGPYETAGGYVMYSLGRLPKPHDRIEADNFEIVVTSIEGKRADRLLITKRATQAAQPDGSESA
jgi:putative hemolysin